MTINERYLFNFKSNRYCFDALLLENKNSITDADSILKNHFRVFNKEIQFSDINSIEWNKDFFSGKSFNNLPTSFIKIKQNKGWDIIVPWEFSKLQFIPTLVSAYLKTRDPRYIEYYEGIIESWNKKNKYNWGVNWMSDLESGIRGINILFGYLYFYDNLTNKNKKKIEKLLFTHLVFLKKKIIKKTGIFKNNHFIISLAAIIILCQLFNDEINDNVKLFNLLREQIEVQFSEDGVHFENCVGYHQLVLESVLITLLFIKMNGESIKLNSIVQSRIDCAMRFIHDYLYVYGKNPQFGDSSDGRIIIFNNYFNRNILDHSFMLDLYKNVFNKVIEKRNEKMMVYDESGYFFKKNRNYGICINGSKIKNELYSGHNHCDKTSFVLQAKNIQVIIEAGTFCYTSDLDLRNNFRKSSSHNIITFNGSEQVFFDKKNAFSKINNIVTRSEIDEDEIRLFHDGYYNIGVRNYCRSFKFLTNEIIISDSFYTEIEMKSEMYFNISPTLTINGTNLVDNRNQLIMEIIPDEKVTKIEINKIRYSEVYQSIAETNQIKFIFSTKGYCNLQNRFVIK